MHSPTAGFWVSSHCFCGNIICEWPFCLSPLWKQFIREGKSSFLSKKNCGNIIKDIKLLSEGKHAEKSKLDCCSIYSLLGSSGGCLLPGLSEETWDNLNVKVSVLNMRHYCWRHCAPEKSFKIAVLWFRWMWAGWPDSEMAGVGRSSLGRCDYPGLHQLEVWPWRMNIYAVTGRFELPSPPYFLFFLMRMNKEGAGICSVLMNPKLNMTSPWPFMHLSWKRPFWYIPLELKMPIFQFQRSSSLLSILYDLAFVSCPLMLPDCVSYNPMAVYYFSG